LTKYRLQEQDYLYLYPILLPKEIKEEYGERSKSERAIQLLYKAKGLIPSIEAIKTIVTRSYAISDIEVPEYIWRGTVYDYIAQQRLARKAKVWERIKTLEELYK